MTSDSSKHESGINSGSLESVVSNQGHFYQVFGKYWTANFEGIIYRFKSNQVGSSELKAYQRNGFDVNQMNFFMSHGVLELIHPHLERLCGAARHILVPVQENRNGYLDVRVYQPSIVNVRWPQASHPYSYKGWVTNDITQIAYPRPLRVSSE